MAVDFTQYEQHVLAALGEPVIWHSPGGDIPLQALVSDTRAQSDHGAYDTVETGLHVSLHAGYAIAPNHEITVRGKRLRVVETEPHGKDLKKVYLL